ncbi:hypothetical protein L1887_22705 [Cichorium endivia]|nr:hypothetical protein L1887_22705 [Cichorium endivia]
MGGVGESEKYLLNRHKENHFTAGEIVCDIIIGVSDGLTVPFALAAGLSGANASSSIILNAGIAEVAAGAISMGLGGGSDTTKHAFDENGYIVCDEDGEPLMQTDGTGFISEDLAVLVPHDFFDAKFIKDQNYEKFDFVQPEIGSHGGRDVPVKDSTLNLGGGLQHHHHPSSVPQPTP